VPHWRPAGGAYAAAANPSARGPEGEKAAGAPADVRNPSVENADVPDDVYSDGKIAAEAVQRLRATRERSGTPFFLAVGFNKPHSPPTAPRKFFDLYDVDKIPLPVDFKTSPQAPAGFPDLSISRRNTDLFIGRESSPAEAREMIRAYYASTSFMDAQVGRVLNELDRLKLRENTIVVFWGDHGYHLGEKGKWSKAYSLWDIGLRVPLIIAVPGQKSQVSQRVVQLLDLYRTLADLVGLPNPKGIEGRSLAPLLRNPKSNWNYPSFAVVQFQGKLGRSVSTERWHYVEWDEGQAGSMLLDVLNDPRELKNLIADPARASTVKTLKDLFKQLPAK